MKRVKLHNKLTSDDTGCQVLRPMGSARYLACAVVIMRATTTPVVLPDTLVYGYASPTGLLNLTNVPTDARIPAVRRKARYHIGVGDLELEQAVRRVAQQHRLQPALLLAVMRAESSFNPTAISKAGAVGLMQLIPETAIRHGVQNLYDTNDNITGGAKHLRYLLDRFHGNVRLAVAAYNAGERKVDRYGQIPPYKETQDYVKKVLIYYRSYKKDGWIIPIPVMTATPLTHVGRPY